MITSKFVNIGETMKNNIFTALMFFIVSLFICMYLGLTHNLEQNIAESNNFLSSNSTKFYLNNKSANVAVNDIKVDDLIGKLSNDSLIMTNYMYDIYNGNALYINNKSIDIPVIKGRFLTSDDVKQNKRYIVIGKNIKKALAIDTNYININGSNFEIIGILGYNNRSSYLDDQFYICFTGLYDKNLKLRNLGNSFIVDSNKSTIDNLKSSTANLFSKTELVHQTLTENTQDSSSRITSAAMVTLVIICMLINVINSSLYYVENKKKEFAIRKLLGGTNKQIAIKILFEYEIIATLSFIVAQIIYIAIVKSEKFHSFIGDRLFLKVSILSFLVIVLISALLSLISIRKSLKLQPAEILRG